MGFEKTHPENEPKKKKLTKEEKRRLELGNRFIEPVSREKPRKKLTKAEKAEIYEIITGNDYPVKKGRPPLKHRNMQVALDFLYLMGETSDSAKDIMRRLAKTYDLPGSDISDTEREIEDSNFHKIVLPSIDWLEPYLIQHIDAVENGLLDKGDRYNNSKICIQGLARYKAGKR